MLDGNHLALPFAAKNVKHNKHILSLYLLSPTFKFYKYLFHLKKTKSAMQNRNRVSVNPMLKSKKDNYKIKVSMFTVYLFL